MAIMVPARAASALVVGWPSASSAQPSGIGCPFWAAAMILPRATFDKEMSTTTGCPPSMGAAKAMGSVPKSGCRPPHGAIAAGALATMSATSPVSASVSTVRPATPQWWERLMPAMAMPCARAMPGRCSSASSIAGKAKPCAASTASAPGRVACAVGVAMPSTLPDRACAA